MRPAGAMNELNQFRPKPGYLILHHGPALFMSGLAGFLEGGIEGFYYRQTRFLSEWRFEVGGAAPRAVSANPVTPCLGTAYYLAASPAGAKAGPEPDRPDSGGEMVRHGIELQVNRQLAGAVHHDVFVTNHALASADIVLRWRFAADFADFTEAEEGRRQQNAPIEQSWRPEPDGGTLLFRYRHPDLPHGCELRLKGPGSIVERDGWFEWSLTLSPQSPVRLAIDVLPSFCGESVALQLPPEEETGGSGLRLETPNPLVQAAWDRAAADLGSLALLDGEADERRTPAAGIPKYMALFGRDVLVTAFQASLFDPAMLGGTVRLVARWNAEKYDDAYDAQPGRVIHQRQQSPLALLRKNPFLHYYGDYSAPGWFLIDCAWHLALTGDRDRFRSLRDKIDATLAWMDRDGDADGDGFYEYETKAGSWGEKNQGWKDSNEAILYPDGRLVQNPIALVEIQGCFYAAKQAIGLALAAVGERGRSQELLAEAGALKDRFNRVFWMEEERYYALALDPDKNPVGTIAADAGQCLAYGIVDDDKATAVADRLMSPELFSGWGIRTLSDRHPAFNPFAYHLGSVWPVANALIGFGFKRYGFACHLQRQAKAMFEASRLFAYRRLPEVLGGHRRDPQHPHPGIYPDANSPQAWSASAVGFFVQSLLGLVPLAPRQMLILDPNLPGWLPELTLHDLRIGAARVSLRFRRNEAGSTEYEVIAREGPLALRRAPHAGVAQDRFGLIIGDLFGADAAGQVRHRR